MDGQNIALRLEDRYPIDVPDRIAAGDWSMEHTFWFNYGLTDDLHLTQLTRFSRITAPF